MVKKKNMFFGVCLTWWNMREFFLTRFFSGFKVEISQVRQIMKPEYSDMCLSILERSLIFSFECHRLFCYFDCITLTLECSLLFFFWFLFALSCHYFFCFALALAFLFSSCFPFLLFAPIFCTHALLLFSFITIMKTSVSLDVWQNLCCRCNYWFFLHFLCKSL